MIRSSLYIINVAHILFETTGPFSLRVILTAIYKIYCIAATIVHINHTSDYENAPIHSVCIDYRIHPASNQTDILLQLNNYSKLQLFVLQQWLLSM